MVLVQRKAETCSKRKRGRELPCKVVKFRSVLLLQLTAVETCNTYALSYLVIIGKIEVGIGLLLGGLILCCQGCLIEQIFIILHLSAKCMVDLALKISVTVLLLRMGFFSQCT